MPYTAIREPLKITLRRIRRNLMKTLPEMIGAMASGFLILWVVLHFILKYW